MEKFFESALWNSRLILIAGVISCVLTAASFVILGLFEVLHLFHGLFAFLVQHSPDVSRDMLVLTVIEILDTFLLSSVLFIFSFGLYELFVSPIDKSQEHTTQAFQIKSIDQLKQKLGKVIIMLLVIKVFAFLVEIKPTDMIEMLYLAIIVLLVSVSLWLGHKKA